MPVTNMAEAMCLLPPPHEHRPVTRQTPSSVLIAGEARCLVPSLDAQALSRGFTTWSIRTLSTVLLV